jgi:hypothetical protein
MTGPVSLLLLRFALFRLLRFVCDSLQLLLMGVPLNFPKRILAAMRSTSAIVLMSENWAV